MRLSWNEIRARAAAFARDWEGEGYEKGQTQLFYRDFFEVFGVPVRRVASFEQPVKNLGEKRGFIDLFWKGMLLIEQKSVGRDLKTAKTQALDYFPGLRDDELPRYVLLSDFQTFELYDLDEGEELKFGLADLPKHVHKLGFITGVQKKTFKDQDLSTSKRPNSSASSMMRWRSLAISVMIWSDFSSESCSACSLMTQAFSKHVASLKI